MEISSEAIVYSQMGVHALFSPTALLQLSLTELCLQWMGQIAILPDSNAIRRTFYGQVGGFMAVRGRGHNGDDFGSKCKAIRRPRIAELAVDCLAQPNCACRGLDERGCYKTNATINSDTAGG
jgi:hypothetical protein